MELHQLRYFLTALEEGSFSKAAARHRLSQQAISKSIARLEKELGVRLLQRDGRRLEATPAGAMLARHAEAIDAETHQFLRHLDELTGVSRGHLEIGTSPTAAFSLVAETVRRVVIERPAVQISVVQGTTRSMTPRLKRGELDAFVSMLAQREPDPQLICEVLFSEPTMLIARVQHPLASRGPVTLADTLSFPWLVGTGMEHWGDLIRQSFVTAGLKPPIPSIRTSSVSFARAILTRTDHLCVLPEILLRTDVDAGRLAVIDVPGANWSRPMALFYRPNVTHSALASTFISTLRSVASDASRAVHGRSAAR